MVTEDKATIVCECLDVTDKEIEEEVLEGVQDFEMLQERTKISTGCGSCRETAEALFNSYRAKYFG